MQHCLPAPSILLPLALPTGGHPPQTNLNPIMQRLFKVLPAPRPDDVNWPALQRSWWQRTVRLGQINRGTMYTLWRLQTAFP